MPNVFNVRKVVKLLTGTRMDEGRFAIVPLEHADAALDVLLRLPVSQQAARIGIITEKPAGTVALES